MQWTQFDSARPADKAMVIYYVPEAKYVWGVGADYDTIKVEYPTVTDWAVFSMPPTRTSAGSA